MEVLSFFLRSPPHLLTSPHLTTPQHTIEACPLGPMEACPLGPMQACPLGPTEACPLGPMQACPLRAMEACPLGPKEAGRWVLWRRVRCVLNSMRTKQLPKLGGPTVCNSETSRHLVRDPTSRTTPPTTTLRPYSHPEDRKTFKHSGAHQKAATANQPNATYASAEGCGSDPIKLQDGIRAVEPLVDVNIVYPSSY